MVFFLSLGSYDEVWRHVPRGFAARVGMRVAESNGRFAGSDSDE